MVRVPAILPPTGNYGRFPPRGAGGFPSAGDIDIWWGQPGPKQVFDHEERRRTSYHFFGKDNLTTVWRSDPVVLGSRDDVFGVPIGPEGSTLTVGSSDIRAHPQLHLDHGLGRGSRRKIYAELHSLRMRGRGVTLLAGEPYLEHLTKDLGLPPEIVAKIFRRSFGEVLSWDVGADPKRDFPADNFFNVFFGLKFAATPDHPAMTLFTREPLVVVDLGLTTLPPFDRVTIPQFPNDVVDLYLVPTGKALDAGGDMPVIAAGGCCAHSVRLSGDLMFRGVDFGEMVSGDAQRSKGGGLAIRTDARIARGRGTGGTLSNRSLFRKTSEPYVDGVFVPNGTTQIASTGLTFAFEDTGPGKPSDVVRDGASVVDDGGRTRPIDVDTGMTALAYQAPQPFGIGLGSNGGITFDIAALRERNPKFYLVALVGFMGMSRESPVGSSVHLRVLVDGVEVPFASKRFATPGESVPISVDLQTAQRYVTLASTSPNVGNGVFALFQLRGFGTLTADSNLPYAGPARPAKARARLAAPKRAAKRKPARRKAKKRRR